VDVTAPNGFELSSRPGERRIVALNDEWCVYEFPSYGPDARANTCLIFESMKIVRRVREYPREWRHLPEQELARIMERR
jgi:hypothetical protein